MFPASKRLLGNLDALLFPHYDDKSVLVDDTGSFIARKIIRIGYDIDSTLITGKDAVPDDPRANESQIFSMFKSLTKKDVLTLIQKSLKKTCGLDPTSNPLVIACLEVLLPVITRMINPSLLGGHFPTMWKEALVDPRFKKAGINDFNNLRPVSNFLYVSKLCLIRCMLTCPIITFILCYSLHTDKVITRRQHFLRYTIATLSIGDERDDDDDDDDDDD